MGPDLRQRGELVDAHATLVLKLLQFQHGFAAVPAARVAGHALVGQAGVAHRVHHLALLADVAHVHGAVRQAGHIQRAHQPLQVRQTLAVLRVVRQRAARVLHLLRHRLDGLRRDLQQRQRGAEGQRVVSQHVLRACNHGNKLCFSRSLHKQVAHQLLSPRRLAKRGHVNGGQRHQNYRTSSFTRS